jgi:hypothetical protein
MAYGHYRTPTLTRLLSLTYARIVQGGGGYGFESRMNILNGFNRHNILTDNNLLVEIGQCPKSILRIF